MTTISSYPSKREELIDKALTDGQKHLFSRYKDLDTLIEMILKSFEKIRNLCSWKCSNSGKQLWLVSTLSDWRFDRNFAILKTSIKKTFEETSLKSGKLSHEEAGAIAAISFPEERSQELQWALKQLPSTVVHLVTEFEDSIKIADKISQFFKTLELHGSRPMENYHDKPIIVETSEELEIIQQTVTNFLDYLESTYKDMESHSDFDPAWAISMLLSKAENRSSAPSTPITRAYPKLPLGNA